MKKYIKYIAIIAVILGSIIAIIFMNQNRNTKVKDGKFRIVTSFYPIYIMTANITQGANNIELINMAETNVGCVHNYTLNTEDVKKIEQADVFIQNGLGLENFMDKIITNKEIKVINASKNITDFIQENNEINPHVWTNIDNDIKQVEEIMNELIKNNPENGKIYRENAEEYIQKLKDLKQKYDIELTALSGMQAVCLNESFEYLGKQLNLNLIKVHTNHEESTMSAKTLKNIIDTVRQNQIQIILVDINDDLKNAQTIANETGATIYQLDSCLTGNLAKDSYINSMTGNLETLKKAR